MNMRFLLSLTLPLLLLFAPTSAAADDGGDAGEDAADDSGAPGSTVPLGCDGALCDTTNDSSCDIGPAGPAPMSGVPLAVGLALVVAGFVRRKEHSQ
jgi:hypothetical protein